MKHVETRTAFKTNDIEKFDLLIKCRCTKETFLKAAALLSNSDNLLQVKIFTDDDHQGRDINRFPLQHTYHVHISL